MFSLPDNNPAGAIIIDTGTTLKRARMIDTEYPDFSGDNS
jgi:hypothetical protein